MKSTESFFAAFDRAGMLKPALWNGGAPVPVRYRGPIRDALSGQALVTDHAIQYPASVLVGLKRGDSLTVGGIAFKVRLDPAPQLDGTRLEAALEEVV